MIGLSAQIDTPIMSDVSLSTTQMMYPFFSVFIRSDIVPVQQSLCYSLSFSLSLSVPLTFVSIRVYKQFFFVSINFTSLIAVTNQWSYQYAPHTTLVYTLIRILFIVLLWLRKKERWVECKHKRWDDFVVIEIFHFAFSWNIVDYIAERVRERIGELLCWCLVCVTTLNTHNAKFYGSTGKLPWGKS